MIWRPDPCRYRLVSVRLIRLWTLDVNAQERDDVRMNEDRYDADVLRACWMACANSWKRNGFRRNTRMPIASALSSSIA